MTLETGMKTSGYMNRLKLWLFDLKQWCEKHDITEKQGLSILLDNKFKGVTYEDLLSYVESSEFIYDAQMSKLKYLFTK